MGVAVIAAIIAAVIKIIYSYTNPSIETQIKRDWRKNYNKIQSWGFDEQYLLYLMVCSDDDKKFDLRIDKQFIYLKSNSFELHTFDENNHSLLFSIPVNDIENIDFSTYKKQQNFQVNLKSEYIFRNSKFKKFWFNGAVHINSEYSSIKRKLTTFASKHGIATK